MYSAHFNVDSATLCNVLCTLQMYLAQFKCTMYASDVLYTVYKSLYLNKSILLRIQVLLLNNKFLNCSTR